MQEVRGTQCGWKFGLAAVSVRLTEEKNERG